MTRSNGRGRDELRPVTIEPGFVQTATGCALISLRRHARDLHRLRAGVRPALDGRQGPRLDDRRVRDAPRLDRRAQAARRLQGPPRRPHGRDPAPDRPQPARRRRPRSARRAHDLRRLRRARGRRRARAARRSPAATSRSRSPCQAPAAGGPDHEAARSPARSPPSPAGSSTASPLLDLDYPEDSTAEVDANVVMTGEGGLVEVQATAERTPLSRAHLDELLALAQHGIEGLRASAGQPRSGSDRALLLATRNAHKLREFERLLPRHRARAAARRARRRPRRPATTYADNALIKARSAAAATGARRSPTTRGIEAEALGWPPRRPHRALRRRERHRRARTSPSCTARRPPAARLRYVCVIAYVDARRRRGAPVRGPLRGHAGGRAHGGRAASAMTRSSSPTRHPRPHDGRAQRRREGRDLPPRPAPRGRCCAWLRTLNAAASRTRRARSRAATVSIVSNTR